MSAHETTLSTEQWIALQALFERALGSTAEARRALVDSTAAGDPVVGQSLAAMLAAHEQWQGRTHEANGDLHLRVSESALLANGEAIGPYRILGVLGEGGMGVVYRVERADGEVALTAAIKVLRPGALDHLARERFKRERDLLAGLNHKHIARLFDAGVSAKGQSYFVMEYVHGATLVTYCDTQRLDVRERLRLFLDVCDAIRHAHSRRVLHRDIKPNNVLVDESGVVKLIDFGIAKPLAADTEYVATETGGRFFSPMNVAPEQLRGTTMGVACDIYQLGTLLYELLCGQPIFDFEGKTPGAIEEAINEQIPLPPSVRAKAADVATAKARRCADAQALGRQLSGDLDEITLMALRKEPARRYASVALLMEDIERHLEVRPVRARGSHRSYRAGRFIRRHQRALSFSVMVFLAAATIGIQYWQLHSRNRAGAGPNNPEEAVRFVMPPQSTALSIYPPAIPVELRTIRPTLQQQQWALALAGIVTRANEGNLDLPGGVQRTPEAIASTKALLARAWGVHDRTELLAQLAGIETGGQREPFDEMASTLSSGSSAGLPMTEQQLTDPNYGYRVNIVRAYGPRVGRRGIVGWDFGRFVALCGWGYVAGYLTEEEAWQQIMPVARTMQQTFDSWQGFGTSYMVGQRFASEVHDSGDSARAASGAYSYLAANPASPWTRLPWKLDLTSPAVAAVH